MKASDRDDLFGLLEAVGNGTLTGEDEQRFYELLEKSPEARELWFLFNDLEIGLDGWAAGQKAREEQAAVVDLLNPKVSDSNEDASQDGRIGVASWWRLPAAALVLLAVGLLVVYVFLLRPGTPPSPSGSIAVIESVAGDVEVVDAAGHRSAASPDEALFCGQALRTLKDDSRATVVLPDGTRITLKSISCVRFVFPDVDKQTCIHLEKGMLKVQAEERSPAAPLVFTTDHARLTVLGTRFRLYASKEASRVELEEGTVETVRLADQQTMMLDEGWSVTATADADAGSFKPQPLPVTSTQLRHTLLRAGEAVELSADGRLLATSSRTKGLKIWDLSDGSLKSSVLVRDGTSFGPAFASGGTVIVSAGSFGSASIWRIGSEEASCTALETTQNMPGHISSDGRWLIVGRRKEKDVAVWEVDADNETISLRRSYQVPGRVWSVAVTPGEKPLVAYSVWDGTVFVRDVASEQVICETSLPYTASLADLSDDRRYLAAYSHAGLVLVDLQTQRMRELWSGDFPQVDCLDFSAEGDVLLAGLQDGTARAWNTADGRAVMIIDAGDSRIGSVAISRDRTLVATVAGSQVKIWECDLREDMANTNQSD